MQICYIKFHTWKIIGRFKLLSPSPVPALIMDHSPRRRCILSALLSVRKCTELRRCKIPYERITRKHKQRLWMNNIYTCQWLPLDEPFWTKWLHTPMKVNFFSLRTDVVRIIRDYHTGFLLSPAVSTRDSIISSRADNGRGLILRAMTKIPCYNLFITYSDPQFDFFRRKIIIFFKQRNSAM